MIFSITSITYITYITYITSINYITLVLNYGMQGSPFDMDNKNGVYPSSGKVGTPKGNSYNKFGSKTPTKFV